MAGQNDFRIFMHKGLAEGETPVSSTSPSTEMASSPPESRTGIVAIGIAKATAMRTFQSATAQIRASGHEQLATGIQNTAATVAFGVVAYKFPPLAVIQVASGAIDAGVNIWSRSRERENIEFDREQSGLRHNFNQMGGVLFD